MNTLNKALPGIKKLSVPEVMRIMGREWVPFLSDSERVLLDFIFQRTYLFNKVCESISIWHFIEGVRDSTTDKLIQAGLGWSKAKIYRNIASLRKSGALLVFTDYRGNINYQINVLVDFGESHEKIAGIPENSRVEQPVSEGYVPKVNLPVAGNGALSTATI